MQRLALAAWECQPSPCVPRGQFGYISVPYPKASRFLYFLVPKFPAPFASSFLYSQTCALFDLRVSLFVFAQVILSYPGCGTAFNQFPVFPRALYPQLIHSQPSQDFYLSRIHQFTCPCVPKCSLSRSPHSQVPFFLGYLPTSVIPSFLLSQESVCPRSVLYPGRQSPLGSQISYITRPQCLQVSCFTLLYDSRSMSSIDLDSLLNKASLYSQGPACSFLLNIPNYSVHLYSIYSHGSA